MELYRVDYTLLGMVSPNCMKVLPVSQNDEDEKRTQKVIFFLNIYCVQKLLNYICRLLLVIKKELFKCSKSEKEKLICYSKHCH